VRIRFALPNGIVGASVLDAALEVSTRAHEALAHRGQLPSLDDSIRRGLRWAPEPFKDGEHFDLAPEAVARGWADCDDFAPWRAAELRAKGIHATAVVVPSGPQRWHALVRMPDGSQSDPSRDAGMGKGRSGVHGASYAPLASRGQHAVALLPHGDGWMARCDLPYGNGHVACVGHASTPQEALTDAMTGYALVGEGCEEEIEVGLWGIPGTKSVTFRDVLKVGLPVAALALTGNPVAAAAMYKAGMWAYDQADEYATRADAPLVDLILAKAVADAKAGQGLVIIRADGTKDIAMANGVRIRVAADGTWTANPPNYQAAPSPPPIPRHSGPRPRPPPEGYSSWAEWRGTIAESVGMVAAALPAPPQGYDLWGAYYADTETDPPESLYPYLTAEQATLDSLGMPMLPSATEASGERPAALSGMPDPTTIAGAIWQAASHPGPRGQAKVLWGESEDIDGSLTWTRGSGGPVLLRV
jgi:hypothetical protein